MHPEGGFLAGGGGGVVVRKQATVVKDLSIVAMRMQSLCDSSRALNLLNQAVTIFISQRVRSVFPTERLKHREGSDWLCT